MQRLTPAQQCEVQNNLQNDGRRCIGGRAKFIKGARLYSDKSWPRSSESRTVVNNTDTAQNIDG
ncbi:hypothetical protein EJB05_22952 [Eragrostis curvula]|uniref:Uncharacterized protein n=1 Tax=Eragrostis curvula TaxID=38414 RepID=A0A5J9V774_9POAL|nr:hypothetical protein EJB05_22952 [Eragrostis curvula]